MSLLVPVFTAVQNGVASAFSSPKVGLRLSRSASMCDTRNAAASEYTRRCSPVVSPGVRRRVGARQGNAGARLGLARPGDGLRATRPRLPFGGGEPPASRVLRDEPAQCLAHNVRE